MVQWSIFYPPPPPLQWEIPIPLWWEGPVGDDRLQCGRVHTGWGGGGTSITHKPQIRALPIIVHVVHISPVTKETDLDPQAHIGRYWLTTPYITITFLEMLRRVAQRTQGQRKHISLHGVAPPTIRRRRSLNFFGFLELWEETQTSEQNSLVARITRFPLSMFCDLSMICRSSICYFVTRSVGILLGTCLTYMYITFHGWIVE